jgi:tetratricopeptide (TPR) repeat protein
MMRGVDLQKMADDGHYAAATLGDEIMALDALVKAGQGDRDALDSRIAAARARWPHDQRLRLIEGGWLDASGRPDAAQASLLATQAAHPDSPWPAVRLVEMFLRNRMPAEAQQLFRDAVWHASAPEGTRAGLLSRVIVTIADTQARGAYLESLLGDRDDDRFVLLKLAAIAFRAQDRYTTERLFARARALGPLTDESRLIELELHLAAARFEEAYSLASLLLDRNPDRVEFARRAIQAAIFAGRVDATVSLLEMALTRWPQDWLLLFRYNRCPLPQAVDRQLFALLQDRATEMAENPRWLFQYAIGALRHGAIDQAIGIIDTLLDAAAVGHMAGPLARALAAHPRATWDNDRQVAIGSEQDVQIIPTPGATATILLFASVVGGLGYLPFGLADGLLRQRPVNILYVRDGSHRSFTGGIASLGLDMPTTITELRRITDDLGVPVITMGSSIAGVAAIRYAALMQGHAAISFAGPVNLGLNATEDEPPSASAANGTRQSLFSAFTGDDQDTASLVRATPRTHVHQIFGAGHAPDVEAARCLEGLDNVHFHPIADCADHFAIEHAIADGLFFRVLDQALASIGGPA